MEYKQKKESSAWSSEVSEDDVLSIASTDSTVDSGITSPRGGFRAHDVRVTSSTSSIRLVTADPTTSRTRGHRADVPEYLKASTRPSLNKIRSIDSTSSFDQSNSTSDRGSRPSSVETKISLLSRKFEGSGDSGSPRGPLRKFNSSPSINDVGKTGLGAKLNVFQNSADTSTTQKPERRLDTTSSRFSQSQDRLDRFNKNETHSTSYVTKPRESGNQVGKVATLYLNKVDSGKLSSVGGIRSPRAVELSRRSSAGSLSGSGAERGQPRRQLSEASFQDKLKRFQGGSDSDQPLKSPRSPRSQVYLDKGPGVVNVKSSILRRDILEWNRFGSAKKPGQEIAEEAAAAAEEEFRVRVPRSRSTFNDRKVSEPVIGHTGPLKAIHPDDRKISEPSLKLDRQNSRPEQFQTLPNKPELSPVLSPKSGSPRDPHPGFFRESFDATAERKTSPDSSEKPPLTFQNNFNSAPKPFVPINSNFDIPLIPAEPVVPVAVGRNFNSQPRPFKRPDADEPAGFGTSDTHKTLETRITPAPAVNQDRVLSERVISLNSERRPSQERIDSPRVEPHNHVTSTYSTTTHIEPTASQPKDSGKPKKFQEVFLKFQLNDQGAEAKSEPGLVFLPSQSGGKIQQSNSITVSQATTSSSRVRRQRPTEEPEVAVTQNKQNSQPPASQPSYQQVTSHPTRHQWQVDSDRDKSAPLRSLRKDPSIERHGVSRQPEQVTALRDRSPGCADSDGSVDSGVSSLGRGSSVVDARNKDRTTTEPGRQAFRPSIDTTKRTEPDNSFTSATKVQGSGILDRISKLNTSAKPNYKSPRENASVIKDTKLDSYKPIHESVSVVKDNKPEKELPQKDNSISVQVSVNSHRQDVLVNAVNDSSKARSLSQKTDDLSVELKNEYSKETVRVPKLDLGPLADSSDETPSDIQPVRRRRTYSTESDSTVKSENTIESIESLQTDPEGLPQDPAGSRHQRRRRQEPSNSITSTTSSTSGTTETVGQRLRRRLDEITNATKKSPDVKDDAELSQRDQIVSHRRQSSDDKSDASSERFAEIGIRTRERSRRGSSARSRDTSDTEDTGREKEVTGSTSDRIRPSTAVDAADKPVIKQTVREQVRVRNADQPNRSADVIGLNPEREPFRVTKAGDSHTVEETVQEQQTFVRRRLEESIPKSTAEDNYKAAPQKVSHKVDLATDTSSVPHRIDRSSERVEPIVKETTTESHSVKKIPEKTSETPKETVRDKPSLPNGNVKPAEPEPEPVFTTKRRGLKSLKQISAFYDEILDDPFSASKSGDESARSVNQTEEEKVTVNENIIPKIGRDLNKERSVNHIQEEYEETKFRIRRIRTEPSQKKSGLSGSSGDEGDLVKQDSVGVRAEVRARTPEVNTTVDTSSRGPAEDTSKDLPGPAVIQRRVRQTSEQTSDDEDHVSGSDEEEISDKEVNSSDSDTPEDKAPDIKQDTFPGKQDIYQDKQDTYPDKQESSEEESSIQEEEIVVSHREPRHATPDQCSVEPPAEEEEEEVEEELLSNDEQPAMFTRLRKRVEEVMSLSTDTSGKKPEFTRLMRDQTCVSSETVVFECRVVGEPQPTVQWRKDGELIEQDQSEIVMTYDGEKAQLQIPEVLPEDEGEYTCEATNSAGTASCSAALLVEEDDLLPDEPNDDSRRASEDARFSSEPEISEEDRRPVEPASLGEIQGPSPVPAAEDIDSSLAETISDVIHDGDDEQSETGEDMSSRPRRRRCRPVESEDEDEDLLEEEVPQQPTRQRRRRREEEEEPAERSQKTPERAPAASTTMSAKGRRPTKPSFIIKPRRQFVDEGQTAKFKASFDGEPPPELVWDKDGTPLEKSSKYNLYENDDFHFLEVLEVGDSDKGCYTCTLENDLGKVTSSANLEVYAKLGTRWKTKNPPKLERPLADKTVSDGERCQLDCMVTGVPEPTVSWYYEGKLIKPTAGIKQTYSGATAKLIFPEILVDDNGTYECVAKNDNGEVRTKARLTVKAAPSGAVIAPAFLTTPQSQTVNDGDRVTIECKVKGSPEPKVTWYKGQKAVKSTRDFKPKFDGSIARLDILEVYPEDQAEYTCVARNSAGEARVKCKIIVKDIDANQNNIKSSGRSIVEKTTSVQSTKDKSKDSPSPGSITSKSTKTVTTKTTAVLSSGTKMPSSQPVEPTTKGRSTSHVISSKTDTVRSETNTKSATPSPAKKESPAVEMDKSKSPPPVVAPKTKRISRTVGPPQFVKRLEDLAVLDGDRVELKVEVQATGPIEVIWLHNDQEIKKTSTVYQMVSDGNVHRLVIPEVFPEDGGSYVCEVYNDIGDEDCQCTLTVEDRPTTNSVPSGAGHQVADDAGEDYDGEDDEFFSPEFMKRPKGALVDEGTSILFSCQIVANPMPRVVWEKDGEQIKDTPGRFVVINDPDQDSYSFEILHTLATDAGRYVVVASNAEGKAQCSVSLNVTAMDKGEVEDFRTLLKTRPKLKRLGASSGSESDKDAEQVDFRGVLTSKTKTKVAATVDRTHEADQVDFREVLTPKGVEMKVGKQFEAEQVDFRGVLSKQGVVTKAATYKGYEGEQVDFRGLLERSGSDVEHTPEPSPGDVRQALNSSRTRRGASATPEKEPEQLDFRNVLTKHVQTKTRPKFTKELYDIRVAEGDRACLECHVSGVPPPKIRWYFNKKEIKESKYFKMSYDNNVAKLVIAEVYPEDDGDYMCRAVNDSGTAFTSCDIHVQEFISESEDSHRDKNVSGGEVMEPPFIEDLSPDNVQIVRGMDFQLKAKFVGEPTPTIKWFHDKTQLAQDKRIKIDLIRDTSVLSVSDSRPDDSGRYTVVVENELGCDTCNSSVTIEDRPNPPAGEPCISTITGTSLTVSWYGPSYDGGSCITDYRVEVAQADTMEWRTLTSSCKYTSFQAKGLSSNTEYVFRISAGNKHGFSDPGKVSIPVVTIDHSRSCGKLEPWSDADGLEDELRLSSPLSPEAFRAAIDELPFDPRHVAIEEGRTFKDHYQVAEEIGKGRFGNVHKCVHKESNRTFAAKFIRVKPSERKEMKHELSVMNELHHPKLLLLYDAFESPREMVLVMEHVAGGELFERIIDDDYSLTERECIHFMRQICDAVLYMHNANILHLDLKPENILCITRNSNEIKIIDFGLARKFDPKQSFRVMFGTPEFVAPEVVNYDQINFATDMWSVGVICYILLSGLSPFLGDNDAETLANVTGAQWDFDDDCFDEISDNAKEFIEGLLAKNMRKRLSATNCLAHMWLSQDVKFMKAKRLSTEKHKRFMARRKWQKTGNAIRALGRMSLLQRTMSGSSDRRSMNGGDSELASTVTGSVHSRQSSSASESEGTHATGNHTRSPAHAHRRKGDELNVTEASDSGIEVEGRGAASPRTGRTDATATSSFKSQVFLSFNSKPAASAEEKPQRRRRSEQNGEQQNLTMPQFIKPMKNFEAFEGTTARFDVRITGDPSPEVIWRKDNQELSESDKHGFERNRGVCSLLIHDCGESDDASYQCVITNAAGSASSSAELYVEGAERPLPK